MLSDVISAENLTKYNAAAKICGVVMSEIVSKIKSGEILSTRDLNQYGDRRIDEECASIYKRETRGVAFTTSISLNNCVSNYVHEASNDTFNTIRSGDVVKIELGVNIGGCISVLGETIYVERASESEASESEASETNQSRYIQFLDELSKEVVDLLVPGATNDDIRIRIESKCTEMGCFPVENTTSYQHCGGQLDIPESKYIITNYQKYYDHDDNLAVLENLCFEFETGDVYTINLTLIENDLDQIDETKHEYIEPHDSHIYRFNDSYYNLRLQMSREFLSTVKGKHGINAFCGLEYKVDGRNRVGLRDCLEAGILEEYPVMYSKDSRPVYHKKFTVIVGDTKCITLKYTRERK